MNANAEAIAAKLSKAGIKGPNKLSRSAKKIIFDIAPLNWCNESSVSGVVRAFAVELARGCLAKGVANVVMEETNHFKTLPFKSPLACFEARQYDLMDMPSYEDIVRDMAIVSAKRAVANGGSLVMAEALGLKDDATGSSSSMATDEEDNDVVDGAILAESESVDAGRPLLPLYYLKCGFVIPLLSGFRLPDPPEAVLKCFAGLRRFNH